MKGIKYLWVFSDNGYIEQTLEEPIYRKSNGEWEWHSKTMFLGLCEYGLAKAFGLSKSSFNLKPNELLRITISTGHCQCYEYPK